MPDRKATNQRGRPQSPTYDPHDLLGEVYLGLFGAGVLRVGAPIPDPSGAILACRDLLVALGVTPVEPADPQRGTPATVEALQYASGGAR